MYAPPLCNGWPSCVAVLTPTETVAQSLERVLFIWAMRHPASGYVQGINDIVTPFYTVMFQERGVVLDVIAPSEYGDGRAACGIALIGTCARHRL